jgi:hypothetical protein
MASSRPIAAGENYTPDDINNLRADVLDPTGGHKHNGVDGARVPFANLDVTGAAGSTAPSGGSKSYNDLANHVAASSNVHGLFSGVNVVGALAAGVLIQYRSGDTANSITFPVAFSANPTVVVTGNGTGSNIGEFLGYNVTSITPSGFTWEKASDSPQNINWIAIGLKLS